VKNAETVNIVKIVTNLVLAAGVLIAKVQKILKTAKDAKTANT
jgi:hypothetical protein